MREEFPGAVSQLAKRVPVPGGAACFEELREHRDEDGDAEDSYHAEGSAPAQVGDEEAAGDRREHRCNREDHHHDGQQSSSLFSGCDVTDDGP